MTRILSGIQTLTLVCLQKTRIEKEMSINFPRSFSCPSACFPCFLVSFSWECSRLASPRVLKDLQRSFRHQNFQTLPAQMLQKNLKQKLPCHAIVCLFIFIILSNFSKIFQIALREANPKRATLKKSKTMFKCLQPN
jgi:hypothetical protein